MQKSLGDQSANNRMMKSCRLCRHWQVLWLLQGSAAQDKVRSGWGRTRQGRSGEGKVR